MKYLRSIVAWIESLETDKPFQKWIPIVLKSLGVVAYAFALVWSIMLVVSVIAERDSNGIGLLLYQLGGSILLAMFIIVAGMVLIMLFWNRSNKINSLHEESNNILLNIAVILIRLVGEVALIVYVSIGIRGLIAGVFGLMLPGFFNPFDFDLSISFNWTFGLISIIIFPLYGIITIVSSYVMAALLNLVVGMAKDLRKITDTLSTEEPS